MPRTATFDADSSVQLTLNMPKKLRERIRHMAKLTRLSSTAIILSAAVRACEEFAEKQRAEEEQERRDKEAKVQQRRLKVNPALVEDPSPVEVEPENDEAVYVTHARLIAEALDGDVRELRLRRDEALAAIRRQFPLTHPPEPEMLAKLERLVKRFPRSKPQESPSTPPKEIDGEKIITIKERP